MRRRQENCWRKRGSLEKMLIVIIVVLLCFILSMFVLFLIHHVQIFQSIKATEKNTTICTDPQCVKAAADILDFVDISLDPCDNFYDFVCAIYFRRSIETKKTIISELKAVTENRLEALITQPSTGSFEKPLQLQRKFYSSCMNTTAIEEDKNEALMELIGKLGDMPVITGRFWKPDHFDWLWTITKWKHLGIDCDCFLKVSTTEVTVNGTQTIVLLIDPPSLLDFELKFRKHYLKIITNMFKYLQALDSANQEFTKVLDFESKIKEFVDDQNQNGQSKLVPVGWLQEELPLPHNISWIELLNNITLSDVPFNNNTLVKFGAEIYLRKLLNELTLTPKPTQANYAFWKLVESFNPYLNETVRSLYESFIKVARPDSSTVDNRKEFCLERAKLYFPSVAEIAYVRKYVQAEVRSDVKEMIERIRKQLLIRISENEWLDDKSKKVADKSLHELEWMIGASDSVFDENFEKIVDMEEFDLETDNVLQMAVKLNARKMNNTFKFVNKNLTDIRKYRLQKSPILEVGVKYDHSLKILKLFAPFLQGIMYDFGRPQYLNYGSLGSAIGHELIHSLMSHESGDSFENSWSNGTRNRYSRRISCLMEEYQNHVNSTKQFGKDDTVALAENLADSVSPSLAYHAYLDWVQHHTSEANLPGLNYTPKQLFWIIFGAVKCYQPELEDNDTDDMDIGIASFQVLFDLKNSPDFASDFNCPIGSNMNPEKKCRIL